MSGIEQNNEPHFVGAVMGRYVLGGAPRIPGVNIFACRARYLSPTSFIASAPVIGEIGDKVSASFTPFGTIRGTISRLVTDGFAVDISATANQRADLARKIGEFSQRTWMGHPDKRAEQRFMPGEPRSVIILATGEVRPCLVVDYSVDGAAISVDAHPELGAPVTIGQVSGRVVRLLDMGFAVNFDSRQGEDVEQMLEAPEEWHDAVSVLKSTRVDTTDPTDPPDMEDGAYLGQ